MFTDLKSNGNTLAEIKCTNNAHKINNINTKQHCLLNTTANKTTLFTEHNSKHNITVYWTQQQTKQHCLLNTTAKTTILFTEHNIKQNGIVYSTQQQTKRHC